MVTPPAEVLKAVRRPEVSLSDENTFPGAQQQQQKKYAPESLGDQATFGGGRGAVDDHFTDDMEIVDLSARYTIEGTLGKGGMGEVQLATDNRLGRKVAIKRIRGDAGKSRTVVSRFLTEAKSIAILNHANIVQIYDYGRDKTGPFLILEYVDGKSLLERCQEGAIPLEEAVDLTCQVCDGLGKAHDAGIIHRDLKPANVLLTKDGVPKLTDFGLARVETGDTGQTMAGAVLGTLDFMPPEQRRDATQADARSDLWSLAATLYQMVTGKTPKIIKFKDVPQSLQDVLGKALEEEKDDRYQTAREFKEALRASLQNSGPEVADLGEGQCLSCGTKNEANRKFCRKCAVSLEVKCVSCSKGMPVWDEICGSCGAKQSSLIAKRKEQLQQRQHQAEDFLRQGKFAEASELTEKLAAEADPRFLYIKKWSVEFTERLGQEQRLQQQRSGVLHQEAKAHQEAHDYSSAIHALEQIPASLRSADISALLMQVQGQEKRTKELNDEIRLRVERRELDGLIARVDELLQLVPDRVDVRDLRDKLEKRDQQRLAAHSSASLEANRLMDARKYAECVAVLQSLKGSLRTAEIEALQKDAAAKQSRLESLQKMVDQAVKNNQLQGLLARVDELLLLKSDATEEDKQLREQLVAREQKQKSQIKGLLQKVHQLRKEARFDKAIELLVGVPLDLRTDAVSAPIEELIDFSEQRSAVLQRLKVAGEAEQIRKELSRAERYRELLASADITDVEFESASQGCRARLEELQRAAKLATQKRQWMVVIGSVVCATLLFVVAGVSIQRQQRPVATAETQPRSNDAAHTPTDVAPAAMPTAEPPAAEPIAISQVPVPVLNLAVDTTNSIGMSFKLLPAGEFMMGSPESEQGRESDESQQQVTLTKPFYLGAYEVTRGQFMAFVNETNYRTDAEKDGQGGGGMDASGNWGVKPEYTWREFGEPQNDSHPVVNVSWNDAIAFCDWLSKKEGKRYRLPTEAEWEYGSRAGSTSPFCFGDDLKSLDDYAWYLENSDGTRHEVGQKKPNAWGLYDMHGGVEEWCADRYFNCGAYRVARGGNFFDEAAFCRSAYRSPHRSWRCFTWGGFRLALSLPDKADAQKLGKEGAEDLRQIDSCLAAEPEKTKGRERLDAGLLLAERAYLAVELAPEQALENARLAVKLNPSLHKSCWSLLANLMAARGNGELKASMDFYQQSVEASDWKEKRTLLEESIAADPTFPWSYNNLAWHLATSENPAERNGQEAVQFALKACELDGYHYWSILDTLAASYAENGQFPEAVLRMTQAIANCDDGDQVEEMEKLLERYKAEKRFPFPNGQEGVD
jgi:formylglycine-generating enzyme required for sulfatase activity/serine/threonine protein kinase